jgi:prepilin-type N-terminal cleavage/methylation domain-containing protein
MPLRRTARLGFTLIELLVVLGIIGALMGILLPALEKAREHANNVRCASNLSQIGAGLLRYANDNRGNFPRTIYVAAAPLCAGTNAAAPDPFTPGGPLPNDVTAALFLLVRTQGIPVVLFADPYTDEVETAPDPAADAAGRSNFTDYDTNCAYSYANPYPDVAAAARGVRLTNTIRPDFVLAADKNPGGGAGKNSRNHEGRGQNVLYADSHVLWSTVTNVGINGDEIYTNRNGVVMGSPVDVTDTVLLPFEK